MYHNISIIIPTLGDVKSLERLIKSIGIQEFDLTKVEIIVIVNGIRDEETKNNLNEIIFSFTEIKIKLVILDVKGVNNARNEGVKLAQYDILLFLDDDCELHRRQFLKIHVQFHNSSNEIFAYGGGYQLPLNSAFYDEVYHSIQMKWLMAGVNSDYSATHLIGGNFSIKKQFIQKLNIDFDKNIVYGGSEYEFFKRATLMGLKLTYNELDVKHYTKESFISLIIKVFKQGYGKAYIDDKHGIAANSQTREEKFKSNDYFMQWLYSYIFWYGYYTYYHKRRYLIKHLLYDLFGKFNFFRHLFLKKLSDEIQQKKDKGERF